MTDKTLPSEGILLATLGVSLILVSLVTLTVGISEPDRRLTIGSAVALLVGLALITAGWWRSARAVRLHKAIRNLTAADFPDVAPEKFDAWKEAYLQSVQAQTRARRRVRWQVPLAAIAFVIFKFEIAIAIFGGILLIHIVNIRQLGGQARKLKIDAGITNDMLKANARNCSRPAAAEQ